MRFMSLIRVDENTGQVPSQRLIDEMTVLIGEMRGAGKLVDTGGLQPTAKGRRVRLHDGKLSNIDGPFAEAKEVVGGYAILRANSRQEVIELTKHFLEVAGGNGTCEIHELYETPAGAKT